MSIKNYYDLCCRNKGKAVQIRTHDGRLHRGIITHVTQRKVYINPISDRRNFRGYGYGFWGPGYGGYGFGYGGLGIGIAIGAIATLAFLPFFFW